MDDADADARDRDTADEPAVAGELGAADEPAVHDELGVADELAALRLRAYSQDADIAADPAALARLVELEDRKRDARHGPAACIDSPIAVSTDSSIDSGIAVSTASSIDAGEHRTVDAAHGPHAAGSPAASAARDTSAEVSPAAVPPRRRMRGGPVAASIVVIVLAGAVWAQTPAFDTASETAPPSTPVTVVPPPDVADSAARERTSASSADDFTNFLDDLRDDVLAGADLQGPAGRIVRSELRPYGGSNGWSSWAGPTSDGQLCLVVSDGGLPIVTCDTPENVDEGSVSTIVTAGEADSRGDAGFAPGTKMRIILLRGAVATEPYVDE